MYEMAEIKIQCGIPVEICTEYARFYSFAMVSEENKISWKHWGL